MKRPYNTETAENITFFVGTEIEHTPAYGMKTLFVVGVHDSQTIIHLANTNDCTHIYFGANQSFSTDGVNDVDTWRAWESMIKECLLKDYWCTLDFDVKEVEGLAESFLCEHRRFIPQISVKIPYLNLLNYNATIKIDDTNFEATNPGVWCLPLSAATQRKYFTTWDLYTKDEIIK
jgi:hypothetical protein